MQDIKNKKYIRPQVNKELISDYIGGKVIYFFVILNIFYKIKYEISENIQFEDVPIITPNGDILIKNMNFVVRKIKFLFFLLFFRFFQVITHL